MFASITIAVIATVASTAAIVETVRDGYHRVPTRRA